MNLNIKNKFVLASILIIFCFLLSACSNTSYNDELDDEKINVNPMLVGSDDELIFKSEYIDYKVDYEMPYINYDEFFLKDGEKNPTTGRYSNVTEDGKINWNIEDTVRLDYTPIAKEMLSKVTLDGEKKCSL